jgi:hypothetical protein
MSLQESELSLRSCLSTLVATRLPVFNNASGMERRAHIPRMVVSKRRSVAAYHDQ